MSFPSATLTNLKALGEMQPNWKCSGYPVQVKISSRNQRSRSLHSLRVKLQVERYTQVLPRFELS